MNQKKVLEAYESFHQLLGQNPFHPLFQFNLGASLITVEEPEKAIKMYKELLKSNGLPPQMEFAVFYNLGVLYSLEEDVDQALDFYQQALDKNPDSKEVKINIELLIQKAGSNGKKRKKDSQKKGSNSEDETQKTPMKFTNEPQKSQYKSKDMSRRDVEKILNELKKQEQRIRAKHQRKNKRQEDHGKNW